MVATENSASSTTLTNTLSLQLYNVLKEQGLTPISDADLTAGNLHLPQCGARTLADLLRAGHRIVNRDHITKIPGARRYRGSANRIAHPRLKGRTSKFCGAIFGVEVATPFEGTRPGINGNRPHRYLLTIAWRDSLFAHWFSTLKRVPRIYFDE